MKWCLLKCGKPPDDKLEEHGPRKEVAFVISLRALMLGLEGAGGLLDPGWAPEEVTY